jgi:hypothetical protein
MSLWLSGLRFTYFRPNELFYQEKSIKKGDLNDSNRLSYFRRVLQLSFFCHKSCTTLSIAAFISCVYKAPSNYIASDNSPSETGSPPEVR